jgi:hypothetical protein
MAAVHACTREYNNAFAKPGAGVPAFIWGFHSAPNYFHIWGFHSGGIGELPNYFYRIFPAAPNCAT